MSDSSENAKPQAAQKAEMPSEAEQEKLLGSLHNILNPNGDNPKVDQYLSSTFGYIRNSLNKISTAEDKDKATKEIADDLKSKLENWANLKKAELAAVDAKKAETEANPASETKTEPTEPEK